MCFKKVENIHKMFYLEKKKKKKGMIQEATENYGTQSAAVKYTKYENCATN